MGTCAGADGTGCGNGIDCQSASHDIHGYVVGCCATGRIVGDLQGEKGCGEQVHGLGRPDVGIDQLISRLPVILVRAAAIDGTAVKCGKNPVIYRSIVPGIRLRRVNICMGYRGILAGLSVDGDPQEIVASIRRGGIVDYRVPQI